MEIIAHRREILSLVTQGYPAATIHRQLGLSGSLRSLQRWLRHMRSGKRMVASAMTHRPSQPPSTEQDGAPDSQNSPQKKGFQRKTFAPGELL